MMPIKRNWKLSTDVEVFTLDASGRFLVPRRLLQACSIDHSVRFIGVDDRVGLWGVEQAAQAFLPPDTFADALHNVESVMDGNSDYVTANICETKILDVYQR